VDKQEQEVVRNFAELEIAAEEAEEHRSPAVLESQEVSAAALVVVVLRNAAVAGSGASTVEAQGVEAHFWDTLADRNCWRAVFDEKEEEAQEVVVVHHTLRY
jgi:hypothetical protein